MKNFITFIIPVRHPDNVSDWSQLKHRLSETVRSISRQDSDRWKAVIVANDQAQLPELPRGFEVKRVDFPPNQLYRQGSSQRKEFYETFRLDKGRRVLAGMLSAGQMGYVMVVDDDDFVSRHIVSYVESNSGANGWFIRDGYIWDDGGLLLYRYSDFNLLCGTSHIIRADIYKLPSSLEAANENYISRMLGGHIFIRDKLNASGTPLEPLPFPGAVYRVGHAEAFSQSRSILGQYFLKRDLLRKPLEMCHRFSRLRIKTPYIKKEFFGL